MLYGCESWTTRKRDKEKINAFEQRCWRRMLGIKWTDKITNASVRKQIGTNEMLEDRVKRQKLSYFGHVVRSDTLEKNIMLGMGEGKRSRGRPKMRWMDEILEVTGLSLPKLLEATRNRLAWRSKVMEITRGRIRPDGTR
jgi:hypothetical protein